MANREMETTLAEKLGFSIDIYEESGNEIFDILDNDGQCYGALNERQTVALWRECLRIMERNAELETVKRERDALIERGMQFMVAGGPVVMAEKFDSMKNRAEAAESQAARLKEALEKEWKSIDNPPISPDGSSSVCVLGMLEDGTHVFAHYTPFYLGKEDESKYLWVCDNFPWATKPKWWCYLPDPPDEVAQPSPEPPPAEPPTQQASLLEEMARHFEQSRPVSGWRIVAEILRARDKVAAGSRPSAPAPSGEPLQKQWEDHVQNFLRQYENPLIHGALNLLWMLRPKNDGCAPRYPWHPTEGDLAESSPVDLKDAARKIVDLVVGELGNFDGYERAVARVTAHLREGK